MEPQPDDALSPTSPSGIGPDHIAFGRFTLEQGSNDMVRLGSTRRRIKPGLRAMPSTQVNHLHRRSVAPGDFGLERNPGATTAVFSALVKAFPKGRYHSLPVATIRL